MAGEFTFEQIFGMRAPTSSEVDDVGNALQSKFNNEGLPVGCQAFFNVPELHDLMSEYMRSMAIQHAEEFGISAEDALLMVYSGVIGTLEMLATLRLMVDDD